MTPRNVRRIATEGIGCLTVGRSGPPMHESIGATGGLHPTCGACVDALAAHHDREIAHAVALEREAIAAWLESDGWDTCGPHCEAWRTGRQIAGLIRSGAHNEGGK